VHDGDLVFWHPQVLDRVAFGGIRYGDDVVGPAHRLVDVPVVTGAFLGQKMRVEQEGQIVDGDDRLAAWPVGRNEIWTVKQIKPQPHQFYVHRQPLETMVTGCPQRNSPKVRLL